MAGKSLPDKQLIRAISAKIAGSSVAKSAVGQGRKAAGSSFAKSVAQEGQKAVVEQGIKAAMVGVAALSVSVAKSRRNRRQPAEAVYRLLHKLRVVGEDALALENEGHNDERQRVVTDAAALRDALHEQLLDLHLSAAARKSGVLDVIEPAVKDADHLMAALNKWALNPADTRPSPALQEAVRDLAASENSLRSHLGKSRRKRTRKEHNTANGKPAARQRGPQAEGS